MLDISWMSSKHLQSDTSTWEFSSSPASQKTTTPVFEIFVHKYRKYNTRGPLCACSVTQSCLFLCDPTNYSSPASSVHGPFQVRILEWIAISSSRGSSQPRDQTWVSCTGRWILYHWATWKSNRAPAAAAAAKLLQSCLTLCHPIDRSPPGSPIPGILQARTLEWVAISFSNRWKWKLKSEVAQSCPTLSDPMDCSLPGSSIHGIFQARVLEGVPLPSPNRAPTSH